MNFHDFLLLSEFFFKIIVSFQGKTKFITNCICICYEFQIPLIVKKHLQNRSFTIAQV